MPFSSESGKWATDRVLSRIIPEFYADKKEDIKTATSSLTEEGTETSTQIRVLDIGVGSGTYSKRYRENILKGAEWVGVEIWEPYIEKYALNLHYDKIVMQDAREYGAELLKIHKETNTLTPYFDLVFLGDVVEHMSKEDAEVLVHNLCSISKVVIISIPVVHYPQGAYDGNPFEEHVKDDWSDKEVRETWGPRIAAGYVENEIGVYVLSGEFKMFRNYLVHLLRPTIGVYSICKNEEKLITRWAKHLSKAYVYGHVNSCVLLDTGSTDRTLEIVRNILPEGDVLSIKSAAIVPWRFDEAKTMALALLPETDFVVSIDIDEHVHHSSWGVLKKALNASLATTGKLPDRINHSFQTIWNWESLQEQDLSEENNAKQIKSVHYHDRVHSRFNWMWALPVHEVLEWKNMEREPNVIFLEDFWMEQRPLEKESRNSYMPLLEQSVKERPDIWKSWSFLSTEYLKAGRNDDALAALESAEKQAGADLGFLEYAKSFVYYDPERRLAALVKAAAIDNIREYHGAVAESAIRLGHFELASKHIELGLSIKEQTKGYKFNADVWKDDNSYWTDLLDKVRT